MTALGTDNAQIAAGYFHTVVLKTSAVVAFGNNDHGQLGDGTTTDRSSPVAVTALGTDNAQIAAGYYHTVVRKTSGSVVAFGNNGNGQLGDGTTTERHSPVAVTALGTDNAQIAAGLPHGRAQDLGQRRGLWRQRSRPARRRHHDRSATTRSP